jgi:hypothetical protein
MRVWMMVAGLVACGAADDTDGELSETTQTGSTSAPSGQVEACSGEVLSVRFDTEDGETLAADHHVPAESGLGAVILFHMIPPSNDRKGYPKRVREALAELGLTVLNVDRRGAGGSTGDPVAAYEGEGARLDMEAAVRYLLTSEAGCEIDRSKLLLVGASNGSTAVHDYTAAHSADLPDPAATAWLSPGDYTEEQIAIAGSVTEAVPVLWLYPTNEPYSGAFVGGAADWEFIERGEVHGTRMFDGGALEDDTVADLVGWAERWVR